MTKPILSVDFDGVIHSYTSGWTTPDKCPDPPVPGAMDFLREALDRFDVCIFSSRSGQPGGIEGMQAYFSKWAPDVLPKLKFPTKKPSARVSLDDRGILFEGTFPSIQSLIDFKPWNKRT